MAGSRILGVGAETLPLQQPIQWAISVLGDNPNGAGLHELVSSVQKHTSVPVCVGFGIGTPEQAKEVGQMADGVIVGTACVRTIGTSQTPIETAKQFAKSFKDEMLN